MVIGPTGCGKTSLLMALLGEMHYMPNGRESWVSLPRERGIAYAAQEAWIQDVTIKACEQIRVVALNLRCLKENILFGTEYNEERYNKGVKLYSKRLESRIDDGLVVSQCCLEPDLKLLESGDQTKARAIYSKAEFILLDDVLSALDVHTSRWIVDKCFRGDLVGGRTLIIVTHNVAMVSEIAEFVVALGHGGRILNQGSVEDVLGAETKLGDRANTDRDPENSSGEAVDGTTGVVSEQPNAGGTSTTVEETPEVGWSALKLFFFAMGGVGFWFIYLAGFVLANIVALIQTYWLGIWARAYDTPSHPHQVNVSFYLGVYSSIGLCGSIRAARRIHDRLVSSVFAAPLYWLDATPIGRIISRFTQDVRSIDGSLPNQLQNLTDMTIQIISRFIAIMIVSPAFSLAGALLLALGVWLGRVYISAQISVKRHMSNARSPMYSYFHAALAGTTTIRAYGAEAMVRREVQARVDVHTRAARTFWSLNRWIAIRMDVLGGLFSAGLAAWLVYVRTGVDASVAGFALNTAVALSGGILWWIRTANEFQVQTNSLERIHSYLVIPHEPSSDRPAPPAHWPSSGSLVVQNLSAGYIPDGARVLHEVSFEIKHGERVAIVGRTGSGKSSLVLALLRMIHTTGTVHYDGMETTSIPLDALRSSITVVPQQPELSSGTIRENLDPFGERPDAVLWDALQAVGFDSIGLDESVAPGGSNLSLGQRQMVALARAIVRRTKLVILDEATAAIDHETDARVHHAIGAIDQTVMIVAHRLRTISNVDKVMVLDAGRLVEFGPPRELLRVKRGVFKGLVDGSGERDELYALIGGDE
ncbi:unnamed protein product [Rhizoctonia solani]|uniref:P-loop containing nucleoside triphosphate hydrolase protein n=1 Tax=Rhizoctonia solani TaxID=456999 RepID=A0A8H3E467_9AGAM|nr:unnamed protein product [Rhizoctonia solani]